MGYEVTENSTNWTFDRMHLFILATLVTYSKCAHRLPCSGGPKPTRHFERLTRGEAAVNELTARTLGSAGSGTQPRLRGQPHYLREGVGTGTDRVSGSGEALAACGATSEVRCPGDKAGSHAAEVLGDH